MNNAMKIVASNFEGTSSPNQSITIGKDVLELLSSSMYKEPLTIYREYIQNAADAIDEACSTGILDPEHEARIEIHLDPARRKIRIRDNGIGINCKEFFPRMTAFGASKKRGSEARGFRGIGRLAGLGVCQELIFRSRAQNETIVSELNWNGRTIKKLLGDVSFTGDLNDLVTQAVSIHQYESTSYPEHFFEVELVKPLRLRNDALLNEISVRDYISQVAPVPFNPDYYFGHEIYDWLKSKTELGEFNIFINSDETPIYKPFRDEIYYNEHRFGHAEEIHCFEIESIDGALAAVGWIQHHDYQGALPSQSTVRGLKARVGNIQVGGHDVFLEIFPESRFNSWTIGEVHILDRKITPNGRRDAFELNSHLSNIMNHLSPIGHEIAKRCRVESTIRNKLKSFEHLKVKISEKLSIIEQGVISLTRKEELKENIEKSLSEMHKISQSELLPEEMQNKLHVQVIELEESIPELFDSLDKNKPSFEKLSVEQKEAYITVIDLIYDCSVNQVVAKNLVDNILTRIQLK